MGRFSGWSIDEVMSRVMHECRRFSSGVNFPGGPINTMMLTNHYMRLLNYRTP